MRMPMKFAFNLKVPESCTTVQISTVEHGGVQKI